MNHKIIEYCKHIYHDIKEVNEKIQHIMYIILPEKRTGQGCKNNPIKTLYKYGQQFKKEAFLRVQDQGGLRGFERTNDIGGA